MTVAVIKNLLNIELEPKTQ